MPENIGAQKDQPSLSDSPVIPFIEGDGIGVDITPAMRKVVDAAVRKTYDGVKKINWLELLAGEKAFLESGDYLPEKTLSSLRQHAVGIKGPLTTPIGTGIRSLNVTIRQILDLYSCVRPVRWYGSPSPLKHPEKMNIVVFRENTEDVYAGVEYESQSLQAQKILGLLKEMGVSKNKIPADSAVGIKLISQGHTKRHVRKALRWTLEKNRQRVTFMHKGNIMKFTEGSFMSWGYEVVAEPEFAGRFVTEADLWDRHQGEIPDNRLLVNDRIADNMLQQLLTRTDEYDLIVAPNLNGDYISDAAAAGVGGLGMAPGANIGDGIAVFEAAHGSAPKYAGQNKANPTSLILSAAMMLEYLNWTEAAGAIHRSLEKVLARCTGTYDLVRGWKQEGKSNLTELSCSEFAAALADAI